MGEDVIPAGVIATMIRCIATLTTVRRTVSILAAETDLAFIVLSAVVIVMVVPILVIVVVTVVVPILALFVVVMDVMELVDPVLGD